MCCGFLTARFSIQILDDYPFKDDLSIEIILTYMSSVGLHYSWRDRSTNGDSIKDHVLKIAPFTGLSVYLRIALFFVYEGMIGW